MFMVIILITLAIPNKPHLSDNIIKPVFENRSLQEWRFIKKSLIQIMLLHPKIGF